MPRARYDRPAVPTLHVAMPVYNERETLRPCVDRVLSAPLPDDWSRALHLVDDHSEPASARAVHSIADELAVSQVVSLHRHETNRGKGAAVQTAFDHVLQCADDEDLVIIQDADLEYDAADYPALMRPLIERSADAVIGTRWGEHRPAQSTKRRMHELGNRALTALSNLMTGFRVSDMECCYKVMPVPVLRRVRPMLTEQRFGIEPQMVAAFARLKLRVLEVPIQYDPRGVAAGKKIGWKDGLRALVVIARERFRGAPTQPAPGAGETER